MTTPRHAPQRLLRGVGYALAILAPLVLLLNPHVSFLYDWPMHFWMIDYYGQYFHQHGELPSVVNLPIAAGMSLPVFYGWLLYPLLGVVSAALGVSLTVRLAVFALVAIQFFAVLSAGRKIFGQERVAFTVAVAVIWATYPLTNLYNRGAIAEFLGTGFLVSAIAFAASAAVTPSRSARWFNGWLAGFFLLLAAAAHPPTAMLAAVFMVLLGLRLALGWPWRRLKVPAGAALRVLGSILLGAMILSPWIYANALFGRKLGIIDKIGFRFYPEHSDFFWGRFSPFPFDAGSMENGIRTFGAPYLEAPISMVLLGLLIWNLELCRRQLRRAGPVTHAPADSPAREILGVAIGWFLFLVTLSLSPALAAHFNYFAPYIQLVYRFVSHCNAALLVAVFASGLLVVRHAGYRRYRHPTNVVLAICLTVAVLALWIKLQHAAVMARTDPDEQLSLAGGQMSNAGAYAMPGLVRELTPEEARHAVELDFPVDEAGPHFGEIHPASIELKKTGWVLTNVMVFPWMKLSIAGRELQGAELARGRNFLAIHLPAGRHEIIPSWQPDPTWLLLRRLSLGCFGLVLLSTAGWAVYFIFPRVRAAEPTP